VEVEVSVGVAVLVEVAVLVGVAVLVEVAVLVAVDVPVTVTASGMVPLVVVAAAAAPPEGPRKTAGATATMTASAPAARPNRPSAWTVRQLILHDPSKSPAPFPRVINPR